MTERQRSEAAPGRRAAGHGVAKQAPREFIFDGEPVTFSDGQTVGAALTAAGVRSWRTTRHAGRPRGLFCGIGICFDCLVIIDGRPSERACLAEAAEGMTVTSQHGTGWEQDFPGREDDLRPGGTG